MDEKDSVGASIVLRTNSWATKDIAKFNSVQIPIVMVHDIYAWR
jgi:hypothetical protein